MIWRNLPIIDYGYFSKKTMIFYLKFWLWFITFEALLFGFWLWLLGAKGGIAELRSLMDHSIQFTAVSKQIPLRSDGILWRFGEKCIIQRVWWLNFCGQESDWTACILVVQWYMLSTWCPFSKAFRLFLNFSVGVWIPLPVPIPAKQCCRDKIRPVKLPVAFLMSCWMQLPKVSLTIWRIWRTMMCVENGG